MSDQPALSSSGDPPGSAAETAEKRRNKIRAAWISFVGRIVAQFIGSAATIVLGLLVLHKYQSPATADAAERHSRSQSERIASRTVARSPHTPSLVVLPLRNLSPDASEQYVADGLTELLTTELAQVPQLAVASRTAATQDGNDRSRVDIAAQLGVRYLLEGSVTHVNGKVRITALLLDASRDEHVWARRYDRPDADILAVQDDVAADVVRELRAVVGASSAAHHRTWADGEPLSREVTAAGGSRSVEPTHVNQ